MNAGSIHSSRIEAVAFDYCTWKRKILPTKSNDENFLQT